MLKPIKIVFSLTGVYVMIKLFDFLLERTRVKEESKTERARINQKGTTRKRSNGSTTKKKVETKKKEKTNK